MSAPAQVEKLLYSRRDAAYALGISTRSIDNMIASKLLPARRYGRRVLIAASAVRSVADRIVRQDILLENGAPVSKLELVARSNAKHATQAQELPEEGARRLRASAR